MEKIMSQEKDINLTILERSMQNYENNRKALSRELKIVIVILLAFQFGIFFRFIKCNELGTDLNERLEQHKKDNTAFNKIKHQLALVKDTLNPLEDQLKNAPASLRNQFEKLENYITILRKSSPEIQAKIQMPIQSTINNIDVNVYPPFLTNLSSTDIDILKKPDDQANNFNDLIKRIIGEGIIKPTFEDLNKRKNELLQKAYTGENEKLVAMLKSNRKVLEKYGLGLSEIEEKIGQVKNNLHALRFKTPDSDNWWKSYGGKVQMFGIHRVNIDNIKQELQKPEHELQSTAQQLTALLKEDKAKKRNLEGQMEKLKSDYNEVQDLLKKFANPLAIVSLEPKEAVLYYPVIILIIFSYFFWRFIILHQRARYLVTNYQDIGLSDRIFKIYFDDYVWFAKTTGCENARGRTIFLRCLFFFLCAIPGIFASISIYWILTSQSLIKISPLYLYIIFGVCFVVSYMILIICTTRNISCAKNP